MRAKRAILRSACLACTLALMQVLGLLLLASGGLAAEYQPFYSAKPIRGAVVDAETGAPLEGVIIVAQWILYEASPGGQNPRRRLQVLETVTGKDGSYTFPGWGPKPNPPVLNPMALYFCCFLTNRDPKLNFFKPGYRPLMRLNQHERDTTVRESEWDGKTIRLEPFRGSVDEWMKALGFLQSYLSWGDQLDWRWCPRMVLAVEEERVRLPHKSYLWVSGLEVLGTSREAILRKLGKQR